MSKFLFRIETKQGRGMYRDANGRGTFYSIAEKLGYNLDNYDSDEIHPSPFWEPNLNFRDVYEDDEEYDWRFGFGNVEQLLKWTLNSDMRDGLTKAGFVVNIYECEDKDIRVGNTQAIFIKKNVRFVCSGSVSNYNDCEV